MRIIQYTICSIICIGCICRDDVILHIIIIIIMSCSQHGYPYSAIATSPYRSSPLADIQGLHPVSSHSCCMYVRTSRPALARPYVGVHRSTSLMSSSLLLQQCLVRLTSPACLVRLTSPACLVRLTWLLHICYCNLWWCETSCKIISKSITISFMRIIQYTIPCYTLWLNYK